MKIAANPKNDKPNHFLYAAATNEEFSVRSGAVGSDSNIVLFY